MASFTHGFEESNLVANTLLSQFQSMELKERQRLDGDLLFSEYFKSSDTLRMALDSKRSISESEMKKMENIFDVSRSMLFNFLRHIKVLDVGYTSD